MRNFIILSAVVVLAGCAQQRFTEMNTKLMQAKAMCDANFEKRIIITYSERAQCFNNVTVPLATEAQFPFIDLVQLANAKRLEIAERMDQKKITVAQGELEMAQFTAEASSEMQRRALATQSVRAQQTQATGALMQGIGAFQQANQPYTPPRQGISCYSNGPYTNCY